jgi:type IV pilus assembly protein PilC
MPNFLYTARDRNGNPIQGQIISADLETVREQLRERDLFLTSAVQQSERRPLTEEGASPARWKGKRVRIGEMVVFSRQLATLVRAGLPINECLYTAAMQSDNLYLRQVVMQVRSDILAGASFTEAVSRHPKIFQEFFVALIRAGEAGGVLDETLETAAQQFDKEAELREKIRSAFTYPIIVIVVAVLVIAFLVAFVIPQFASFYKSFNAPLPGVTLLLLQVSQLAVNPWIDLSLLSLLIGGFFGFRWYVGTPKGRRAWDNFKLKVPLFGPLNRKIAIARLTRTLAAMTHAGVPILEALQISARVSNNVLIEEAMRRVGEFVQQGARLWMPMEETGHFPPMVIRMIAAGEESGNVEEMLSELTRYYDRDVEYTVQRLTRMLEPALTVVIGGLVLFILLALYMPIFNISNVLKAPRTRA